MVYNKVEKLVQLKEMIAAEEKDFVAVESMVIVAVGWKELLRVKEQETCLVVDMDVL